MKTKIKLKYKVLLSTILLTTFVLTVQVAMQFMSAFRVVSPFEKREGSWYSIAQQAQGYMSSCQIDLQAANDQLEAFRKVRDEQNADILN